MTRPLVTLRRARLAAGMTQAELARAAGVSRATISRLETGAANRAYVDTLLALGVALNRRRAQGVSLARLIADAARRSE